MHVHLGLKIRVKPAAAGPVADTYLELKRLCLFYFVLGSEKNIHSIGTVAVPEKRFYTFIFIVSIPNVNLFLGQFIP